MMFDEINDNDFLDLARPGKVKTAAPVKLRFTRNRSSERVLFVFAKEVLAEIGGPRFIIRWAADKRLFLITPSPQGPFEEANLPHGRSVALRAAIPPGLVFTDQSCDPEFYVDAVGKRLLIEVPKDFGVALALTYQPPKPAAARIDPDPEPPPFPREFGGQRFTPQECAILDLLSRREQASRDALMMATAEPGEDDERDDKIIDVLISKLRPKLRLMGLSIDNIGSGMFRIHAAQRKLLRSLIEKAREAA